MLWSGVQREKPRNARSTQSGADQARVFISYAREDIEVAQLVRSALLDEGVEVFLDTHDIAPGERWKDRIGALIAMAESVVFLVSPDAVVSKVAAWELDQAEAQGKRILPIVVRHTEQEAIPNRLQDLNHIHFIQRENLPQVLETLQVAISTDLVWERKRTRINDRAMTWDRRGRRLGLLTLEDDIRDAEMWRDTCPDTALAPTEVQLAFINASRNNRSKRQRNLVAGLSVTLAVVTCLAGLFFFQRDAAIKSERVATDRLGRVFMERASASFGSGNPWLAAKYALAATQFGESIASDHRHLITAIAEAIGPLTASLQQTDVFLDMQVGPTGEQFLTVSQDGAASLFDLAGNTIWRSQAHELAAADIALSPDGSQVVTSGYDSAVAILDMDSGAMVIDPKLFDLPVRMSLWSPDATTVLSVLSLEAFSGDAFELALWRVTDRETLWQISVREPILSARFINEGQAVLTVSASGAISKIDAEIGAATVLRAPDDTVAVLDAAFAPEGNIFALVSEANVLEVFDIRTLALLFRQELPGRPNAVSLSQANVVIGYEDGRLHVFDSETGRVAVFVSGHNAPISQIALAPQASLAVTMSTDGLVRFWDLGWRVARIPNDKATAFALSPNGKWLAFAQSAEITLVDLETGEDRDLSIPNIVQQDEPLIRDLVFAADGTTLLALHAAPAILRFDPRSGALIDNRELFGFDEAWPSFVGATISPSGAVAHWRNLSGGAVMFQASPEERATPFHVSSGYEVVRARFSKDGESLAATSQWGDVRILNAVTGATRLHVGLFTEQPSSERLRGVSFLLGNIPVEDIATSSNGAVVAYADNRRRAILVHNFDADPATPNVIEQAQYVHAIAMSPDGSIIATAEDTEAVLYSADELRELSRISVTALALTLDAHGRLIAQTHDAFEIWDISRFDQPERTVIDRLCTVLLPPSAHSFSDFEVQADALLAAAWAHTTGSARSVCN